LPQPAQTLFLIDAMSLVFRAFFAPMQMALVAPSGLPTKAVYIFLRTLRKLLKDHHPAYLAVPSTSPPPPFATNSSKSTKPTARSSRKTSRFSFPSCGDSAAPWDYRSSSVKASKPTT